MLFVAFQMKVDCYNWCESEHLNLFTHSELIDEKETNYIDLAMVFTLSQKK